jgi:hypothetical protein
MTYHGCASGTHTSWTIAQLGSAEEPWKLAPELLRVTAHVAPAGRRIAPVPTTRTTPGRVKFTFIMSTAVVALAWRQQPSWGTADLRRATSGGLDHESDDGEGEARRNGARHKITFQAGGDPR